MTDIPDTRIVIRCEDYVTDPSTAADRETLTEVAYSLARHLPTPAHFVFRHKGEEIGEMIIKRPFEDREQ